MTNQELEKYRIQLFRDAAGMEKKPDRTPLVSFFVTWKILDSPYKLTEAMNDYDKMEQVVRHHQEAYGFDTMFDFGTRNPYRVAQAMSSPTYIVDDEAECVSVRDIHICEPKQGAQLAANYEKFLWEVGMAQKFPWWKEDASLQKIQNAYDEMMRYFGYSMKIKNIMKTEYGLPGVTAPNPYAAISMENILGFILGMRGTAMMMRRDKPGLHAMIDAMNELFFTPQLEALKKLPEGGNMDYCFDYLSAMLAHNFMNPDQFAEFYWPYMKQVLDVLCEKKMHALIFSEGTILRYKDCFKDYPKGFLTILPETDDVFEIRKELPNIAIMGGMPNSLLGRGTKQACLDRAKRVIDELEALGKPFVILLNSTHPDAPETRAMAAEMEESYGRTVLPVSCLDLDEAQLGEILQKVLYEFPVRELDFALPRWVTMLDKGHWLQTEVYTAAMQLSEKISRMKDVSDSGRAALDCEAVENAALSGMNLADGVVRITVLLKPEVFYKVLSEQTGLEIGDEAGLMPCIIELAKAKRAYEKIRSAMEQVEATGYGIVMPSIDELSLEQPEIVRQGGRYGVRLEASAPSIHMMKAVIHTELSPIVGTEKQSEDLVQSLLKDFEDDPVRLWESNIFGKSLHELVNDGLQNKLLHMPQEARGRLQETLERVINEGCTGLICILI